MRILEKHTTFVGKDISYLAIFSELTNFIQRLDYDKKE